jgi:myo-inositol-hexaphosphate 3-phosphohydrolase
VKDWIDPGLLAWLAAGATALVALVVLSLALFSPRSDSSLNSSPASIAPTTTTGDARRVAATVETEPVPHSADAADDAAIWIHPTDPSLSTVLGTDKVEGGGLGVYDL